ncbi:hypothetical protein [Rhizobium phaseoli]|uniref:hypothetical protein n=1 Tax=Rhizobium phaseoli TaxID=396 RepID=UPI0011AE819C|nr:hypothetical protein [Rhizobium phaseoli]
MNPGYVGGKGSFMPSRFLCPANLVMCTEDHDFPQMRLELDRMPMASMSHLRIAKSGIMGEGTRQSIANQAWFNQFGVDGASKNSNVVRSTTEILGFHASHPC